MKHPVLILFIVLYLFPYISEGQNCDGMIIIQHPLSTVVCEHEAAVFRISCQGQGLNLTYQWRKNEVAINGAMDTIYTIKSASVADTGNFDVIIKSVGCPDLISNSAALIVHEAPPLPYVGVNHSACGCQNATAKAQRRDAFFQAIPNLTFVWYNNPNRTGTPLPSVMSNNISLCNTAETQPIYACELANGCYSLPSQVNVTVFPLPTTLPKVFYNNAELPNFGSVRSCDSVVLTASPTVPNRVVSWYATSSRSLLLGTGNTLTVHTSQTVFVFDEPEQHICTGTGGDTLQCFGTPKQIDIIILPKPTVNLGIDQTICKVGDTKTITATVSNGNPPFEYLWSTGATTPSIVVSTSNTYRVTVTNTDFFRCTATDDVVVSSSTLTVSTGVDKTICPNTTTQITASVIGGTTPFSYQWSNGQNTPSVNIGAGTYYVTVTDANGCSVFDDVKVTVSNSLTVNAGADKLICSGTTTQITASVTGGTAPFSYLWSSGQNSASINVGVGSYGVTATDANGCSGADSVIVGVSNSLIVNAGADKLICSGTTTQITASVTGGTAPFSYLWSSGQNTASINVGVGSYSVTATDANGCSGADSVIVGVSNSLTVNAGADKLICSGTTTQITASVIGGTAPFSYLWSSGQNTPSINEVGIGIYQVGVTDANGCFATDTVNVSSSGALNIRIEQVNNRCNGARDGRIFITPLTGTPPFSYSIDNGTSWSQFSNYYNLAAGVYPIIVKAAGGCTYSKTIAITETDAVSFSAIAQSGCNGGTIKIENVSGGNGTPYQYSINYGLTWQTSNVFSNLSASTYSVRVRDSYGCISGIKTVVVSQPQPISFTVSQNNGSCGDGGTITIGNINSGIAPYQYSKNGGNTWQSSASFTNLTAGVYAIRVRDSSLCLSNSQFVQIIQTTLSASIQQNNNRCFGATDGGIFITALSGTAPFSYSIDNGNKWFGTANFYNLAAGTYSVKVRDNLGCIFSKSITITEKSAINFTATTTATSCNGTVDGKIAFNAVSGGSGNNYKFSIDYGNNLQNSNIFKNLGAGFYNLRVQDGSGCMSAIQQVRVQQPLPIIFETTVQNVSCGSNSNGIIGIQNVAGGTPQYKYSKNDGNSYQNTNSFLFLSVGNYPIRVKDSKGCESASKNVVVTKNCGNINLAQQARSVQKIPVVIYNIAPNPSDDIIRVELNSLKAQEQEFVFFDALGRPLLTHKKLLDEGIQLVEFDISNLPSGVYQIVTIGSYARNVSNRFVRN